MNDYENLLKDLNEIKSEKLANFLKPIVNVKLDVLGIYSKDIKKLIKKKLK